MLLPASILIMEACFLICFHNEDMFMYRSNYLAVVLRREIVFYFCRVGIYSAGRKQEAGKEDERKKKTQKRAKQHILVQRLSFTQPPTIDSLL
jgi:hypothetical protein